MKIFYNGKIITLKNEEEIFGAICIEDGKIKALGTNDEILSLKDDLTELVDLEGKSMFPGFIDPHSHYGNMGLLSTSTLIAPPPVGTVTSIEDMINIMKEDIKKHQDSSKLFMAYGYDHEQLAEGRHPIKDDLDKISKDIPIAVLHASLHVGTFNSKALEVFGIEEEMENPEGGFFGRYEGTNKVNGYAEESAFQLNLLKGLDIDQKEIPNILKSAQNLYAKAGITTVQDGFSTNNEFPLFKFGSENGFLDLDVHCYPPAIKDLRENNKWVTGEFGVKYGDSFGTNNNVNFSGYKIVLDGSPQARTAWMSKPYEVVNENDDPNYVAYPIYDDIKVVQEGIKFAMEQNAPVLVHCNGDASGDQFLSAFEAAKNELDKEYTARAVMIHCQTIREDQIDKMAELNIVPAMFPIHTYFWGDVHIKNFGRERANKISNQRYALSKGLLPTSHEDCPVLPPNTILSVWAACNRTTRSGEVLGEELRLTRYEALRSVTYNAAYQYAEEDIKGTLEVGKNADLVITELDLLHCSNEELFTANVSETIKNGKTIFSK